MELPQIKEDEEKYSCMTPTLHREDSTETIKMNVESICYHNKATHLDEEEGKVSSVNLTPVKARPGFKEDSKSMQTKNQQEEPPAITTIRKRSPLNGERMNSIYNSIKKSPLMQNPIMNLIKETKFAKLKQNCSRLIMPIYPNRCNKNNITYINKKNRIMAKLRNARISNETQTVSLKGNIDVKLNGVFTSWKQKYSTLINGVMRIYQSQEKIPPEMVINFNLISLSVVEEHNEVSIIDARGKKILTFMAANYDEWFLLLQADNKKTKCYKKMIIIPKYTFNMNIIESSLFKTTCETGDLLLFSSKSITGGLQRVITGSCFDHVGVVLRSINNDIYLLDATSDVGVSVLKWEQLIDSPWHKFYSQIVYRRLNYQRTNAMLMKLDEYIKGLIGKKFAITASKIFRPKQNDGESYFCSELVASIYKFLGILPIDVPSSSYWPGRCIT